MCSTGTPRSQRSTQDLSVLESTTRQHQRCHQSGLRGCHAILHQTQWGTAALHGQITLKNGRVEQSNFHDYEMLRINELPAIEVHIVRNSEPPGGMGECGTSAIVPAVSNAIFAATGKRLRKMPIDAALLKQPV